MNSCSKCIENEYKVNSQSIMLEAILEYLNERDPEFGGNFIKHQSNVYIRRTKETAEKMGFKLS